MVPVASEAEKTALNKIFQGVSDLTGVPQDSVNGFAIVYVTDTPKVGIVSSLCCPGHTARLLAAEVANLEAGMQPDIIVVDS